VNPDAKKFLMYLPENELHEWDCSFIHNIIRKRGHNILYLGQSTPINGLVDVVDRWHPDFLVTGALTSLPFGKPEDYLKLIGTAFRDKKILVSGILSR
jgi:methanogenic corrinoid protein MtbC1